MAEALARQEIVVPKGPVLAMANRFSRYKSEEEKMVRKVEVQGDELSYLRQRREMLRSMTPEQVLQMSEFHKDLNVFEALAVAKKEEKIIIPQDVHDRIFTETDIEAIFSAWTGTAVIYEAPDTPFGDKVAYDWKTDRGMQYSVTFNVLQQFRGKTNCALVVEHPDFEFVDLGNNRFELKAAEGAASLLEHFPKKKGWYRYDERFRIPVGNPKKDDGSTKHFWRKDTAHIGLVAFDSGGSGRQVVYLYDGPSVGLGVAIF
ncbi:hypothetical protein H0O00_05075 [Candidatus Micrarchaeota archaeon]|nr:hypothetical protein [Candidatus Micrarchaeota archaeon]